MSGTVIVNRGKLGTPGVNAINGAATTDIRFSKIDTPLLDVLYNNNLSRTGDISFSRTGDGVFTDRYGSETIATDAEFTNEVPYSDSFSPLGWYNRTGGAGNLNANAWSVLSTGNSDPLGGSDATHFTLDKTIASGDECLTFYTFGGASLSSYYSTSFYIKELTGTITGVEMIVDGDVYPLDWTQTGGWVKVESICSAGLAGGIYSSFTVIGTSGATFGFFHPHYGRGLETGTYIATAGARGTLANTDSSVRGNQNGYLIETASTNIVTYSNNLSKTNWVVSGATLGSNTTADPFGAENLNNKITFSTSSSATITKTVTTTNSVTYTVSAYFKLISGTLTTVSASVGGGTAVEFTLPTSGFVRLSAQVTAGTGDNVIISIVSPSKDAVLIVSGVQCELDNLSSYMQTSSAATTRPIDLFTVPYQLGKSDEAWTVFFEVVGLSDGALKYIFHNGLTGGDAFYIYYTSNVLYINIGGTLTSFTGTQTANDIALVFDATNINLYVDGIYVSQAANAGTVTNMPSTLTIGSDGTNGLDAQLSKLKVWDFDLTALECQMISGV